ncbi:MAG: shikimate kinase [Verrucomicrobiota bacterium]|jgi:shikimate kinase
MNIILIGFMASGKTTVGKAIARRSGRPFLDLDAVIEEKAGMSIPTIFSTVGEKAFRDLESHVVNTLSSSGDGVVSCGGGVILREINRERLRQRGFVVWLKSSPETVLRNAGRRDNRPLLRDKDVDDVAAMLAAREPFYRAAAHASLEVASIGIEAAAVRILEMHDAFAAAPY